MKNSSWSMSTSRTTRSSKQIPGRSHLPCPDEERCGSSDGFTEYDDGHGYCYVCETYFDLKKGFTLVRNDEISGSHKEEASTRPETTLQYLSQRGISNGTAAFYGVRTEVTLDGTPYGRHYPYPWGATKVRIFKNFTRDKKQDGFWWKGDGKTSGLFGRDRFDPGSAPAVIITEGEEDALAAREMLGDKYAIVSVQSGSSAKADVTADREWVNSFNKIYLCLDNDDVGKKAAKEIARVFNYNKVFNIPLTKYKDANDYLLAGATESFRSVFYGAKRFIPEGIISSWDEFRTILKGQLEKPIGTYPFQQLNDMARGLREGEIVLFDALEGVGKTEIIRAIEHHLLRTTDHNIGCIHLEESKKRQLLGLVGLTLKQPIHLDEDAMLNEEGIFEQLKQLTKRDDRLHIYSHFGSEDPDVLLDAVRVLAGGLGCKFIFLDHITQIVTGLKLEDERRVLDYLATRFAMMVEELNFCLIMVSHVNDDGQTRGSRLISKAPDLRVSLLRDVEAEDPLVRNTCRLLVRKNRYASSTGPAGNLYFDPVSFTLSEKEPTKLPPLRT